MTLFIYKPHTFITRPCVCCLFLNRSSTWSMNNEPSMKIRSNTLPKKSNIIMSLCETLSIIYSYNRYIYTHIVHIFIWEIVKQHVQTLEVAMMLGSSANGLVWRPPWFSGEKQPMMILLPAGHFFRGTRWKNHPLAGQCSIVMLNHRRVPLVMSIRIWLFPVVKWQGVSTDMLDKKRQLAPSPWAVTWMKPHMAGFFGQ
jgi:hypothetical protein